MLRSDRILDKGLLTILLTNKSDLQRLFHCLVMGTIVRAANNR